MDDRALKMAILYAASNGGTGFGVSQVVAGTGIGVSPVGGTGAVTVSAVLFTSALFTLNQGAWSAAHGLGTTPSWKTAVLVCVSNDAQSGFVVGQEVEFTDWFDGSASNNAFGVWADATNVYVSCSKSPPLGNEIDIVVSLPAGGNDNPTSFNNWRLKMYARP